MQTLRRRSLLLLGVALDPAAHGPGPDQPHHLQRRPRLVRRTLPLGGAEGRVAAAGGDSARSIRLALLARSRRHHLSGRLRRRRRRSAACSAGSVGRRLSFARGRQAARTRARRRCSASIRRATRCRRHGGLRQPGRPLYPADAGHRRARRSSSRSRSSRARKDLPLGYFTDGARGSASYQVMLGATGRRGSPGQAVIDSQSLQCQGRGDPAAGGRRSSVAAPAQPEYRARAEAGWRCRAMPMPPSRRPRSSRCGEFHLYTLPGKATLQPGQHHAPSRCSSRPRRRTRSGSWCAGQFPMGRPAAARRGGGGRRSR